MIELNKEQKIAGFIFAGIIFLASLGAMSYEVGLVAILGLVAAAGLVIWCLYKKPK